MTAIEKFVTHSLQEEGRHPVGGAHGGASEMVRRQREQEPSLVSVGRSGRGREAGLGWLVEGLPLAVRYLAPWRLGL